MGKCILFALEVPHCLLPSTTIIYQQRHIQFVLSQPVKVTNPFYLLLLLQSKSCSRDFFSASSHQWLKHGRNKLSREFTIVTKNTSNHSFKTFIGHLCLQNFWVQQMRKDWNTIFHEKWDLISLCSLTSLTCYVVVSINTCVGSLYACWI